MLTRLVLLAVCLSSLSLLAEPQRAPEEELARATHALNRLGYGPRPGEAAQLAEKGVEQWIRAQLAPAKAPEPVVDAFLAQLPLQSAPAASLVATYREAQEARREAQRKMSETSAERPDAAGADGRMEAVRALGELQAAKVARAVLAERQLEEVLVDFWFNHFNVDARKAPGLPLMGTYERETIRPHVFGRFRELLGATARSPSMLVYLDNWRSASATPPKQAAVSRWEPGADPMRRERGATNALRPARQNPIRAERMLEEGRPTSRRGLNENYGRELLELHTLGVDGGYSQRDVQEVARAFTGWTIDPASGAFTYRAAWHDDGPKIILGHQLRSRGQRAGEEVLDRLAAHPATARQIATKLCQRFVADEPPPELVARVEVAFTRTDGDLRATCAALFLDPEFFVPAHRHAKTKSPFEYVVSALRAIGAIPVALSAEGRPSPYLRAAAMSLGRGGERPDAGSRRTTPMHLVDMGQSLYAWGPPTGFPEDSTHWISAGALVARLNYALALTSGQVADVRTVPLAVVSKADADEPNAVLVWLARSVLGRQPSDGTLSVLHSQMAESELVDAPKLIALLLGSPDFQCR